VVSLAEAVELLIKNAAQLRAAGVASITVDGFAVTLAPYVAPSMPDASASPGSATPSGQSDPLYDSATFGGASVGYELDKD